MVSKLVILSSPENESIEITSANKAFGRITPALLTFDILYYLIGQNDLTCLNLDAMLIFLVS